MNSWKNIGIMLGLIAMMVLAFPPTGSSEDGKNIEQMITTAKTPADHKAIADFYQAEGVKFQRESEEHAGVAKKVASEAGGQMPWASHHYEWAEHCRKLAASLGQAAQEAQSLAKIHEGIAQSSAGRGGK